MLAMSADSADPQLESVAADSASAASSSRLAEAVLSVTDHVVERLGSAAVPRDRSFWVSLSVAAALHALLFIGIGHAVPRMVGDVDGSADGISVSVVTEQDLRSQSSVAIPADAAPGEPAPQPQPQAVPPPPPPPEQQATPQPPTPEVAAAEPPPELRPTQPPDDAEQKLETSLEKEVPDLMALPGPGEKPAEKSVEKPAPKTPQASAPKKEPAPAKKTDPASAAKSQQKRVANLDLTPPPSAFTGGGRGRGAGMERPPGITRSGANDAFARDVIRALQQTMPQLRDVLGRTTVRIILNENGNVVEVQVVRPANNAIDQSVVFAAKQTSYPFPPPNSNLADRTFLVTYIYH